MKKLKYHNHYKFYHLGSFLVCFLGDIYFGGKVLGKENIPVNGRCILAGNHTSNFDSYLLFKATKRPIHIVAKKELLESRLGIIFKWMHLIPVDRKNKNPEAKKEVIDLLNDDKIIGIFPEGTFPKDDKGNLLPFKPGVISFAEKANAPIIPFAIVGNFKFRSRPQIIFGNPLDINKIKEDKLTYLQNLIQNMVEQNKKI